MVLQQHPSLRRVRLTKRDLRVVLNPEPVVYPHEEPFRVLGLQVHLGHWGRAPMQRREHAERQTLY